MHFFWPSLRCKVIEQMVKSRYLVEFPAQKKEPKWFQNLGRFKKNSSCSVAKKSPKNWTRPCLSLNMAAEKSSSSGKRHREMPNLRLKVRTQRRPAQVATACQNDDRITYCGGLGSEGDKTILLGPKNWNPISSSKCTVLARHG